MVHILRPDIFQDELTVERLYIYIYIYIFDRKEKTLLKKTVVHPTQAAKQNKNYNELNQKTTAFQSNMMKNRELSINSSKVNTHREAKLSHKNLSSSLASSNILLFLPNQITHKTAKIPQYQRAIAFFPPLKALRSSKKKDTTVQGVANFKAPTKNN